MTIREAVQKTGLSYRRLAEMTGVSKSTLERLVNDGELPVRRRTQVMAALAAVLAEHGLGSEPIEMPGGEILGQSKEAEPMKLDPAIIQHFRFTADPFVNDVEDDADVFRYKTYSKIERQIREAIDECAMVAVVGPVGSGKTTMMDGIEADLAVRGDVVCKPRIKDKEKLSDSHLTRALLFAMTGETAKIPANAEDQGRLLSRTLLALRMGHEGGRRVVLYIDDAHHCNAPVLRALKAFHEEKAGRHRLLAIVLVGTEELPKKLYRTPEIGHRTRMIEIPPVFVREYLDFKLKRVGSSIEQVFETAAAEALFARFRRKPGVPALGYPLEVNNVCSQVLMKMWATLDVQPGMRVPARVVDLAGGSAQRAA